MIIKHNIDVNTEYYIKVTYHDDDDIRRLYQLIEKKTEKTVAESFNRDSFLLKASKIIKINNQLELLVASI